MTFPNFAQPGPRPGPPLGNQHPVTQHPVTQHPVTQQQGTQFQGAQFQGTPHTPGGGNGEDTGHPAVDAVLRSLANAARLAPAEQIAEYEAAHQVLQETLASIDR
ncbi:hypothetical protein FB565_002840 [Actinoplanes lutulentus]|uniref:Uncharacterized protein n=1 Tax=Actinoplanes lutulentus TaxID=1287878 RepID=A0A327YX00_9ACTN|nr:hypothetical protein [Actinoplanes lutulentus]MBB2943127.1 hypothetical protein [Actinoplanes lutulentus]RAK25578.1 hypothetical protein B0I29_13240 [Actinoplanes lutulentus]